MKKGLVLVIACCCGIIGRAQDPVTIIKEGVTKVIKAVDLEIQRIQTQTVVLQEAQQEVQNIMSALRLEEIRDWVQQQKDLYTDYFNELWQVKTVLTGYHPVKEIITEQEAILAAYQRGLALFRQDAHFSPAELDQMIAVYSGIVTESGKNLAKLTAVLSSFTTQMTDQQRMALIDQAAAGMDRNYRDMQLFTDQNAL